MSLILQKEVDNLKKNILSLGGFVEEQVHYAVKSLIQMDKKMAEQVVLRDADVDQAEVEMEESCLKLLALYQPVATDLRFIIAVLKINSELERIGDLAVNIAKRTQLIDHHHKFNEVGMLSEMTDLVESMLKMSLDSLVNQEVSMAVRVCDTDDEVDQFNRELYRKVCQHMKEIPEKLDGFVHFLNISHQLERIADLTTNIAEDVLYMIQGKIVRHHVDDVIDDK